MKYLSHWDVMKGSDADEDDVRGSGTNCLQGVAREDLLKWDTRA